MGAQFILILFLAMGLMGCATVKKETITQLQLQVSEMEHQLAQDQQEIQNLKSQLGKTSNKNRKITSSSNAPTAYEAKSKEEAEVIKVQVSVGQVQIALKKAGYYTGAIDSKLGANTKKAIASFQREHGLNPDGVVGQRTWLELKQYID